MRPPFNQYAQELLHDPCPAAITEWSEEPVLIARDACTAHLSFKVNPAANALLHKECYSLQQIATIYLLMALSLGMVSVISQYIISVTASMVALGLDVINCLTQCLESIVVIKF